ncbi:peptide-methionine (S)-S-oxide reductase MsrA [Pelagibacteraceae bacterium]|nr:peptide-methionine (S)-S-oxide reductase MsrA [Pelagibacteraceae bacterium]
MEKALFGAGCFWGVEETFRKTSGVIQTLVGYSGGDTINPSYESVCQGNTNHTEVVLVEFDNSKISFEELLLVFWKCHDPTTLNRQGPDIGTQYRSAIYFYNEDQKIKSINSKNEYAKSSGLDIVTEISKAKEFYKAEEYHQKYIQKTGLHCAI